MQWVATLPAVAAGFVQVRVPDPNGPPLEAGIWYPSEASSSARGLGLYTQTVAVGGEVAGRSLPLVGLSHGTGGSFPQHYHTPLSPPATAPVRAATTP